jgi:selenocysteine insertion sequence-binding protein 2
VANKRYVVGFNQVQKYAEIGSLKFVLIAPDLEPNEVIDETVEKLKQFCKSKCIPYVFSLKRRKIGFITKKKVPVSCVGIVNYEGANEIVRNLLGIVEKEREKFSLINKGALS